jgi:cytochrome P450
VPVETPSDLVSSPYPALAELRAQGAVHSGELMQLLNAGLPMSTGLDAVTGPSYSVVGHEQVWTVLRSPDFSSKATSQTIGQFLGRTILEMDEPEHKLYRRLIAPVFTRNSLKTWHDRYVVPEVAAIIDSFTGSGSAELVRDLTQPLPIRLIAHLLGLPLSDVEEFQELASVMVALEAHITPQQQAAASSRLRDYFLDIIAQRRRDPKDDVVSLLCLSEVEQQRLTDEEIVSFLRLLLPAGAETTYRASGNLLFAVLSDHQLWSGVKADPALIPMAVEETLRWEPPIMAIGRVPTIDVELAGVAIPAGSAVHLSLGAANHDSTVWDRPDEFDVQRRTQAHMAFASGPHLCIGLNLARMEMGAILRGVMRRFPYLRFDPDAGEPRIEGIAFRSPPELPVVWEKP